MQRNTRRLLLAPLALVAIGGAVVGGLVLTGDDDSPAPARDAAAATTSSPGTSPSAAPTTASTAPTTGAASASTPAPPPAPSTPALQPVDVVLGYAGWYDGQVEASGFAAGIVQSGGTCTLALVSGSARVEVSHPATADASTTTCGLLAVPGDQLSTGTWQATLSYRSATHSGQSAATPVEVTTR